MKRSLDESSDRPNSKAVLLRAERVRSGGEAARRGLAACLAHPGSRSGRFSFLQGSISRVWSARGRPLLLPAESRRASAHELLQNCHCSSHRDREGVLETAASLSPHHPPLRSPGPAVSQLLAGVAEGTHPDEKKLLFIFSLPQPDQSPAQAC